MAIALMRQLGRPLLLEGEAGVGKTEVGKALAAMLLALTAPHRHAGAATTTASPGRRRRRSVKRGGDPTPARG
jgi:hypothetical protein